MGANTKYAFINNNLVLGAERWRSKEHNIMMIIIIIIINNNQRRDNCFWLMVFIINISSFLLVFEYSYQNLSKYIYVSMMFFSYHPHSKTLHKYLSPCIPFSLFRTRASSLLTVYNFDCRQNATATKQPCITKLVDYNLCATCFVYL